MDSHDPQTAREYARTILSALIRRIQNGNDPAHDSAWPIQSDPVLRVAHRLAQALYTRRRAVFKKLDLHRGLRTQRRAEQRRRIEERMSEETSAETFLTHLQKGQEIALDRHTLVYMKKLKGMVGANPHGQDYYAGTLTLENVKHWRNTILSGKTFGEPPTSTQNAAHEDLERQLLKEIDHIDGEFRTLAALEDIQFTSGLHAVLIHGANPLTPRVFVKS
jgi:hypothetical protein